MNYHLVPDDKYVMSYIEVAEDVAPKDSNIYIVRDTRPYKYLPEDDTRLIDAPVGSNEFNRLVARAGKGDKIFIHFINYLIRGWLAEFDTEASICWVYWGNDFYEVLSPKNIDHFDPITQRIWDDLREQPLSRFALLHHIRKFRKKRRSQKKLDEVNREALKAASKIDYMYHYMRGDHELVKQRLNPNIQFRYFNYPNPVVYAEIERILAQPVSIKASPYPKNIWVGNCGYPWVNHADSFERIKYLGDDVGVCVPLSYGDEAYTEKVIELGKSTFGDRFIPFQDYITFAEFVQILNQMDVTIQDHNAPWAMGNISMLLYMGKKVYMKDHIPSYNWFLDRGVYVESSHHFKPDEAFEPIPEDLKAMHRHVVSTQLSKDSAIEYIRIMLADQ